MTTTEENNQPRGGRTNRTGKGKKPPTLESMLSDVRKAFGMQLNTFLAQFVAAHTDEEIDAFLPEEVSEADEWIEDHVSAFTNNEDPTVEDMVDGASAVFMMAFLERLYEACGINADGEEGDEGEDSGEYDVQDGDDTEQE